MTDAFTLDTVVAAYDDCDALRGVSLRVSKGERVGLVGPNGAGKTTLLHVLMGLQPVREGEAIVLGLNVGSRSGARAVKGRAGLVFQNADDQLFCGTVFDDVAFGPLNLDLDDDTVRRRVRESLERVGAADLADRISHHLSAGEKRRVALAATLAMAPDLLLLDEPTGELDPRSRRELIGLLRGLARTMVVATHDLEFVLDTCDRVVVLDDGAVVADGVAADVLADADLMESTGLEVPRSLQPTPLDSQAHLRSARAG